MMFVSYVVTNVKNAQRTDGQRKRERVGKKQCTNTTRFIGYNVGTTIIFNDDSIVCYTKIRTYVRGTSVVENKTRCRSTARSGRIIMQGWRWGGRPPVSAWWEEERWGWEDRSLSEPPRSPSPVRKQPNPPAASRFFCPLVSAADPPPPSRRISRLFKSARDGLATTHTHTNYIIIIINIILFV